MAIYTFYSAPLVVLREKEIEPHKTTDTVKDNLDKTFIFVWSTIEELFYSFTFVNSV